MDEMGEISLALDIYADESCVMNTETNSIVQVYGSSTRVKNEVQNLFNKTLMLDHKCRSIARYLCKYGDAPFRIVISKDRKKVIGLKRLDVFNFTRIETSDGDLVAFHYTDVVKNESYFMHPWEVVHFRLDNLEEKFHPYGKCCKFGSKILTPNGFKNIEDFKPGDDIYAYHDNELVPTKVVATCNSGTKKIYEIRSKHYSVQCSGNHPILVRSLLKRKFGDIYTWYKQLQYKRADEIRIGDEIVALSTEVAGRTLFEEVTAIEDGGYHPTADLQIAHEASNFVADGVVVHNSVIEGGRKAHKQLTLMESSAIIYRLCVVGDTQIRLVDGNKAIRDVEPGDSTLSYNNLGELIETKVLHKVNNGVQDVYKLEIDGSHVIATSTHPFLVYNIDNDTIEYVDLADIAPGKHFAITPERENEYQYIFNVEYVGKREVFDIEIDHPCHNFIANEMVIHNTRSPQKRKFTIPVGTMPSKKVPEYLRKIAAGFKNKKFFNAATGEFDERSVQLTQEDDIFLPVRSDGVGPNVENLAGSDNMGKIEDVEYFLKKVLAPTKIPPSRVGIGDKSSDGDSKPLSQISSDFAKNIGWVQQVMAVGLTKVALVHLALQGFNKDEMESFWVSMSVNSATEELYRIETWQTRVNIMADMRDLGWFPKEWIISKFTDLSPDEIEQMMMAGDSKAADAPELGGGGGGGGGDLFGGGGGEDLFGGDEAGGEDPFGDAGGDAGDDAGGDGGADPFADVEETDEPEGDVFEESIDDRLEKLNRAITEDLQLDRLRRYIGIGKKDQVNSIAESLITSNELLGLPKSDDNNSKHAHKLIVESFESIEGYEMEQKEIKFEYFEPDPQYGVILEDEEFLGVVNETIKRERRLFVNDRNNEIIGKKLGTTEITEDDVPVS
jgi:hypothetical protein